MRVFKGNTVFVDREIAKAEGINVERLAQFYAERIGLRVIHEPPTEHDDGTATCHGCDTRKPHNVLYFEWYNCEGRIGLYGICRQCSGNDIKLGPPSRDKERLEAYERMIPRSDGPRSSDRPAGQAKYVRKARALRGADRRGRLGTTR